MYLMLLIFIRFSRASLVILPEQYNYNVLVELRNNIQSCILINLYKTKGNNTQQVY